MCKCKLIVPTTWNPSSKENKQYQCKECKKKYLQKWREKNPGAYKEWKYGVTQKEYDKALEKQEGLCAICSTDKAGGRHNTWHIDHDHSTGKFRGLLCWLCNSGLGKFKDNEDLLYNAAAYLRGNK